MFDYALRIQAYDGYASKLETLLSTDRFVRTIRVHHTGKKRDNPHYHLALTTDYKKDALRKELKKHFTLATGNKHLSLKDWDGSLKYIAYILHEDTEPDLIKGFTEEELTQSKEINEVVQQTIKSNTKSIVIQEACEYFSGKNPRILHIFSWLYDRFKASGEWMPNRYQYERYIDRIQATLAETPQEVFDHKKALLKRYGWVDEYSYLTDLSYDKL